LDRSASDRLDPYVMDRAAVAEFVDDEEGGLEIAGKFALEAAGGQGVDDVYGGGEEHRVSVEAGGVAERDRQMRWCGTR
jgi:hypothetical protein